MCQLLPLFLVLQYTVKGIIDITVVNVALNFENDIKKWKQIFSTKATVKKE